MTGEGRRRRHRCSILEMNGTDDGRDIFEKRALFGSGVAAFWSRATAT
jgi:hypothetical protein